MTSPLLKFSNIYGVGLVVYFGIGLLSALTEWGLFATALLMMPPVPAACAGFLVATNVNFLLSRRLAFTSRLGWFKELSLVMVVSAAVFAWNLALFYFLYKALAVPIMTAKMIGTLVGFVLNYSARQFWIFSRASRYAPALVMFEKGAHEDS